MTMVLEKSLRGGPQGRVQPIESLQHQASVLFLFAFLLKLLK